MMLAREHARRTGANAIGPEHIFAGLLHGDNTPAMRILSRLGAPLDVLQEVSLTGLRAGAGPVPDILNLSPDLELVLSRAWDEATAFDFRAITTEFQVLGLMEVDISIRELLATNCVSTSEVRDEARKLHETVRPS